MPQVGTRDLNGRRGLAGGDPSPGPAVVLLWYTDVTLRGGNADTGLSLRSGCLGLQDTGCGLNWNIYSGERWHAEPGRKGSLSVRFTRLGT